MGYFLAMARGRTIRVTETDYDIVEVLEDPDYPKHFLRRFKIARDIWDAIKNTPLWMVFYKNNPELLLRDTIDETKRLLERQSTSATLVPPNSIPFTTVILPAVNDWICEKENREPPFEPFPNTIKSYEQNYKQNYAWREKHANDEGQTGR